MDYLYRYKRILILLGNTGFGTIWICNLNVIFEYLYKKGY